MRVYRLPNYTVEARNDQVRIRLQALPGAIIATVTIYQLKPNGFYASRRSFTVPQPVTIDQLIEMNDELAMAEALVEAQES